MLINVENARDAREALRAVHSWLWAQTQGTAADAPVSAIETAKDHVEEAMTSLRAVADRR